MAPDYGFEPVPIDKNEELRVALQDVVDSMQNKKQRLIYLHALNVLKARGRAAAEAYLASKGVVK